jgi:tetratricopeptide (TPR) repeat protein
VIRVPAPPPELPRDASHVERMAAVAAIDATATGLATAQAAVAADPNDARAHYELGLLYALGGSWLDGKEQVDEAARLAPEAPRYELAKAGMYLDVYQAEPALEAANRVLARDPRNAEALGYRALAASRAGDVDAAQALVAALAARPDPRLIQRTELWQALIALYRRQGDLAAERHVLERLLEESPGSHEAERAIQEVDAAIQARLAPHRLAVEAAPTDLTAACTLAAMQDSIGLHEDAVASLEAFEQRIAAAGLALEAADHARLDYALGVALRHAGRREAAAAALQRSIDGHSLHRAEALYNLGEMQLEDGRVDEAITSLEASVSADPWVRTNRLALARALEAAGRPDEATRQRQRAARLP